MGRGDDRPSHCLRLDDDPAEPLGIARSGDDDVGQHVRSRHVTALFDNAKEPGKPVPLDGSLKLAAKSATLFGTDQYATDIAPAERSHGGNKIEPALPPRQAPGKHHDRHTVGQPPLLCQAYYASCPDSTRIEQLEVDAAGDRAQSLWAYSIHLRRVVGDKLRNRDDPLAPRHHRIIPALERDTVAVSVVKRCNKVPPGGARR